MTSSDTPSHGTGGSLGTFAGVFIPSILTILGIILFLRLGYVVGSAGLGRALLIIALANVITVLTSISLAAVATNLKVKGGGDYYLISRTLGVEFGGAIGIVLFLAQSVSIAFYCIGFGEAVSAMLPDGYVVPARLIAAVAVIFLFIFAWLGADWATKFQYLVMALLCVALLSFFWGGLPGWDSRLASQNWATPEGRPAFWIIFAIFFPAVTGFTQGVSMSGDLKDPGRSLPLGTFLAVGLSVVVYFGVAIVFAGSLPNSVLANDYTAMKQVAQYGFFIDAGVISATLSSAMASFLGAPRILQALAGDKIFPILNPFAKGSGAAQNPRRGVLLSGGIAGVTIGLGNLNVVAPVVSMFFLISYGLLNYATFYEARSFSPSFRPRFRWFHYRISLIGALACLGVILAIDFKTGLIAGSVLFGIFQYIKRTAGPARWADSQRSHALQRLRTHLLSIGLQPEHPRDWRPQILAFSADPDRRARLLTFASWIEGRSGMTTVVRIVEGEGVAARRQRQSAAKELTEDLIEKQLQAFPLVVAAPDIQTGTEIVVQSVGIGPLRANTMLLNWLGENPADGEGFRLLRFGANLRVAFRLGQNIIVFECTDPEWKLLQEVPPEKRRMDVWWFNDATSRLMLLLAYLMTRSGDWENARIRVLTHCPGGTDACAVGLAQTLDEVRIEADAETVSDTRVSTLTEHSADAAMVFLPFRFHFNQIRTPFDGAVDEVLANLPATAIVLAAEDIDLEAEPEEGPPAELAAAQDAYTEAKKRFKLRKKEVAAASEAKDQAEQLLDDAVASTKDSEIIRNAQLAYNAAEKESDRTARKAAKAKARLEDAVQELKRLGVVPERDQMAGTDESMGPTGNPEFSD